MKLTPVAVVVAGYKMTDPFRSASLHTVGRKLPAGTQLCTISEAEAIISRLTEKLEALQSSQGQH